MKIRIAYEINVPEDAADLSPILDAANEALDSVVYNVENIIDEPVDYDEDNAASVEYVK
tara:strand:- start:1158 stop:1334 length:177 start_codon:yes stop_codon:yes gene_type:complete